MSYYFVPLLKYYIPLERFAWKLAQMFTWTRIAELMPLFVSSKSRLPLKVKCSFLYFALIWLKNVFQQGSTAVLGQGHPWNVLQFCLLYKSYTPCWICYICIIWPLTMHYAEPMSLLCQINAIFEGQMSCNIVSTVYYSLPLLSFKTITLSSNMFFLLLFICLWNNSQLCVL
jgi:hypothetical protein